MESQVTYGEWVRSRRKALDLTQAALARRVGCAAITIRKIEAGDRRPSAQIAELLANHLYIPEEERAAFLRLARGEYVKPMPPSARPIRPPAFLDAQEPGAEGTNLFVARKNELAFLFKHFEQALDGSGRPLFISGEAGSGKTTLMAEFSRRAFQSQPALLVMLGTCDAFSGTANPFLPFREALDMLCGGLEPRWRAGQISHEQALRGWRMLPFILRILAQVGPELAAHFLSVNALLSRAAAREPLPAAWKDALARLPTKTPTNDMDRARIFEQYERLLQAISQRHPLLLILDDLQWADAATLALLSYLASRLPGRRVMIIAAYRSSELSTAPASELSSLVEELARRYGRIRLDLDNLDLAERQAFVTALLDDQSNRYDQRFRTTFFWQTKGHPLFSVELLQDMQERGDLVRSADGAWQAGPEINWDRLPVKVKAVVARRLGRLDEELYDLLQAASVEGEHFTAQVLSHALDLSERRVIDTLERVLQEQHGLVRAQGEWEIDAQKLNHFSFAHALFQQYLYGQLGEGRRRLLHGEVGAALEMLYQETVEDIAPRLAAHFLAAGQGVQASKYYLMAGDQARTLYAHQEAITLYRQALTLFEKLGDLEGAARTYMKIGLTYQIGFDFDQAREAYASGFALWKKTETAAIRPEHAAPHPLRIAWRDPLSLDPTMGGWNLEAPITTQLFSGLVGQTVEGEIVPDVAASWDILDGGTRIIFHLREDVFWSDGQPLTAVDFEFTFRRALDPAAKAPVAGLLLYGVKGARAFHQGLSRDAHTVAIRALGAYTLEIELEEPTVYLLQDLSYYVLLPVPRHAVELHGQAWAKPENLLTSGPFRLVSWERGRTMRLERNPTYHGRAVGNVEVVELIMDWEAEKQVAGYEADELDVVYNWFLLGSGLDPLRRRFPEEYERRERYFVGYMLFDIGLPPFDDQRVRRAVAMAIDKEKLVREELLGYADPAAGGFVPPGMPGHSAGIGLPFDPQEARRLLAEAGYAHGRGFPRVEAAATTLGPLLQAIRSGVNEHLGIDFELQGLERSMPPNGKPQVLAGVWWADYADPDNFLRVDVRLDYPDWHDPRYDALLAQARRSRRQQERVVLYRQADRILMDEALIVPLFYDYTHLMMKPWVGRFDTTPVKNPGFWKDVIIDRHDQ